MATGEIPVTIAILIRSDGMRDGENLGHAPLIYLPGLRVRCRKCLHNR